LPHASNCYLFYPDPRDSIAQIAEAKPAEVEAVLKDAKAAKSLQTACKTQLKKGTTLSGSSKRSAQDDGGSGGAASSKRRRAADPFQADGPTELSPQELEASLDIPVDMDEERIGGTVVETNRAPVVLAFALELLRCTMPEQPPSSRLSLAQAVVSANSRSKAVSLGLEKGMSADAEGWGEGQPRVKVMGREVAVLKRSGYEWKGEEEVGQDADSAQKQPEPVSSITSSATIEPSPSLPAVVPTPTSAAWSTSQPLSLKSSTFVGRATALANPSQRPALMRNLLDTHPSLRTATHNAWAYRVRPSAGNPSSSSSSTPPTEIREESFDDGETGCGAFLLRLLRETNTVDTLVVMSRWYGGILLGPDRWRLMRNVVTSALGERLRLTGSMAQLGGEAVWGLDLEAMRGKSSVGSFDSSRVKVQVQVQQTTGVVAMQIHRPEVARAYLLKSFPTASSTAAADGHEEAQKNSPKKAKRTTHKAMDREKEENLSLLLGALRLLYDSWADHLTPAELDGKAWRWYCDVRPHVDFGPSGWGAKGVLKLADILHLRRKEQV
jgi:hypothetical protein